MTGLPLEGITVVSIEQAVAAPFATRQLADLGARVIKIEREAGDFARAYDTTVGGEASYFVWLNRGKESVVMDLKSERDQSLLRSLLAHADVFVENLAPGAVERLGFTPEVLEQINPRLISVSVSGFGSGGPHERKKAYDLIIQCEAGMLSVTGGPEAPAKVGVSIADISAGMYAYSGVLAALIQRGRTGTGSRIEVSMLEALGEWMQQTYLYAEYSGAAPKRSGASHASIAPYGPFRASDGVVFLGLQNEREWAQFCDRVLEQPELTEHPDYASNSLRVANGAALSQLIEHRLGERTVAEVQWLLDNVGIANAQMRTMAEFSAHPQLAARDRWRTIKTPSGEARVALPPVTFGDEPPMGDVPALGEHTERIFAEFGS
ncbi:CoA transferase [Leucobacter rhizosphaerae]|uniref:CoA transferase n=1 Tax=Leucobacter rhizosphaerae TaxID=2932245 RepID=A0ABY4FTN3_9MICO|nr:CaiB/BaiF CoA-transferase family protein [Leucobacter rhizosphaerae]UOQ59659.1 CoA transferase [Leucobacter rhizosphaerae]